MDVRIDDSSTDQFFYQQNYQEKSPNTHYIPDENPITNSFKIDEITNDKKEIRNVLTFSKNSKSESSVLMK